MSYAIMRCVKLKQGNLNASLKHCYRTIKTDNANSELTAENVHARADNELSAREAFIERLPTKRRKDAVVAVEYMMTASPEWFEQSGKRKQDEFFAESMKWLRDKYGADNVLVATIHKDETTPHLSAFVTPITEDGRLSAKEFIGNKTLMSDDQTSYAKAVEGLGLKRGIRKSKAKHKDIKTYYAELNDSISPTRIALEDIQPRTYKVKEKGVRGLLGREKVEEEHIIRVVDRLNKNVATPLIKATNENKQLKERLRAIEHEAKANYDNAMKVSELERSNKMMWDYAPKEMAIACDKVIEEKKKAKEKSKQKTQRKQESQSKGTGFKM